MVSGLDFLNVQEASRRLAAPYRGGHDQGQNGTKQYGLEQ
jgi:hypothetical protein